ncbi:MAG: TlpA family protein disulfide reductase [Candidatus Eisenbacteria bacterium]|uniref:TlpA family protein disulfide reductase n=1 Tax=Eiseniibacteriota bacterium TaxID=2212470 RepID=A0A849SJ01_UNCEI|nr:TlpA family protein disulfide reductase [Candidatus Eisenbacteria bacterium]
MRDSIRIESLDWSFDREVHRVHRLLLFTVAATCLLSGSIPVHAATDTPAIAPSFTARTLDGKTLKSSDLKGRPMVIDFWATWCGPCRASMRHLDAVHLEYEARGLLVLGFSVDEEPALRVKAFGQKLGVHFPLAMANERLLDQYGPIRQIPTTFFVNRQGQIVRRVVGYIDRETLESYVQELF